jgi:hypothetical protein
MLSAYRPRGDLVPEPAPRTCLHHGLPVFLILFSLFLGLAAPTASLADDLENCLLCHRYRGLSTVDDDEKLHLYYVNEDIYDASVHGELSCQECHADIDALPHEEAEKVDCMGACHIREPTTQEKFSHEGAAHGLTESVHSPVNEDGTPKPYPEDYPGCTDCHDNPMYRPIAFDQGARAGISETSVGRCRVCHEDDEFIFTFYTHVTSRLHRLRSPKNTVEMCARCHNDRELVLRHGLGTMAAYSYEDTFHGKAADLGSEVIPDCLSCHVPSGQSVHQMLTRDDPASPTHPDNKAQTCMQQMCHPSAAPRLASYSVHAEFRPEQGLGWYAFNIFFYVLAGAALLPLLVIILLDLLRRHFPGAVLDLGWSAKPEEDEDRREGGYRGR